MLEGTADALVGLEPGPLREEEPAVDHADTQAARLTGALQDWRAKRRMMQRVERRYRQANVHAEVSW
jgi:hypothetical protein